MQSKQAKPSISPARLAAFDTLRRVVAEDAYASILIASLDQEGLSREDRALAQEITLGVLRRQKTLDYFIERYGRRDVKRIDLEVLIALRIGLYQLRYLARIPHSAAVNESVNLVKRARLKSASGMVNAVLRAAARNLDDKAGASIVDPAERLAVELSHPGWMIDRWTRLLGEEEARALALSNNLPPPLALRVNTLRATPEEALALLEAEGVTLRRSGLTPGAFVVEGGAASAIVRAAESGLIYIQDEASQLVSLLLDPKSGHSILDLCAAPGSKSSHVAALTGDSSWLVSSDLHPHRLATLRSVCSRLGIQSIDVVALDARRALPLAPGARGFDRVLIDAPCSGTGTLRRNPEIKWRLTPGDIPRLAGVQLELLGRGAEAVAAGGRLVYSTCSVEPEENEGVIERFLESGAPFRLVKPDARPGLIAGDTFVRTFPHRHGSDGFFAAVLERT